jgi:hypothetical protein
MPTTKKVPGLDYLAAAGKDPNVSFGVVQVISPDGKPNTMESAVCRRLFPRDRPKNPSASWDQPTCYHVEVLLPPGASDELWKPQALCRAYDRAAFPSLRDILFSITLRAPELEGGGLRIHDYNRVVTDYARVHLAEGRNLPVVSCIHVPAMSAMQGFIHWHLLAPCRAYSRGASGPSTFCTELIENGRSIIEDEWCAWKKAQGL